MELRPQLPEPLAAYLHDPATNRLRSRTGVNVPSTTYDYDASGNMTSRGTQSLTYDAADRLIQADRLDTPGTVSFTYDGDNNRIRRQIQGGETRVYVTDGLNTLAEADPQSNRVLATYTYGPSGLIHKAHYSPHTPAPPAQDLYFHQDGLGSTALITNQDGEVLERYEYDPFGQPLGGVSLLNQHAFTGKEHEPEIGLQYFNARWLDPTVGRFTQVDPVVGDALHSQDWNQYAYVRNNPVNLTDPTGEFAFVLLLGAGGGGAGLGEAALMLGLAAVAVKASDAINDWLSAPEQKPQQNAQLEEAANKPAEGGQSGETPKVVPAQSAAGSVPPPEGPDDEDGESKESSEARQKLSNIVKELVKGEKNPNRVGDGSTADAIRSERATGMRVGGRFHLQKGQDSVRALEKWLRKYPNASSSDKALAKQHLENLKSALEGIP